MNKYIRTKDGKIYQVYDKVFDYKGDKRYQLINSRFEISLSDVVKEADTIEELCDKYVVEFNFDKDRLLLHRDFDILHEACNFLYENFRRFNLVSIKGAIWTDKGLIYIAKLNNEGKLELL